MDKIPNVFIEQAAVDTIRRNSRKHQNVETGGLILGYTCDHTTCRSIFITKTSGPGKNAQHAIDSFQPDMDYYKKFLRRNAQVDYLGEWHTHPRGVEMWSAYDYEQARNILQHEDRQEMLCVIYLQQQDELKFFYMHRDLPSFLPLSYTILPTVDRKKAKLQDIYIEESYLRSLLRKSNKMTIAADYYEEDGVLHVFSQPNKGNARVLLCHKNKQHLHLRNASQVILIVDDSEKELTVRSYYFHNDQFLEINTHIVSTTRDQFARNNALIETNILRKSHVVIIGLGSVGSVSALELARAGVGKLTLIDPDTVAITNLARHVCDLSELGIAKVKAVKRRIKKIVPRTKVHAHNINSNTNPDKTLQLCRGADVILVATDTENSRRLANWIAYELNIAAIFAGVLERATGGRVWRIVPNVTCCYECHCAQLDVHPKKQVAYSKATNIRDLEVQPGLGNDIAFISHLSVRYVIESLKEPGSKSLQEVPCNAVFWFNRASTKWQNESLSIFHVKDIAKNPKCCVCGGQNVE